MASQLMERFLRTRLPEAKTLADDHSHHGGAGTTWQVIPGAATFFGHHDNVLEALLLWLALSFMLALPWAALWSGKPKTRLCTVPITIVLLAAPPLGLIGVASPITVAGILFP